jgi:hypothetical protein
MGSNTPARPCASQSTGMGMEDDSSWMASILDDTTGGIKGLSRAYPMWVQKNLQRHLQVQEERTFLHRAVRVSRRLCTISTLRMLLRDRVYVTLYVHDRDIHGSDTIICYIMCTLL